jgi:hypothetical protein
MKAFFNKIKNIRKQTLIKNSFLLPILLVVFMSISHVVSWYDLGNPLSWAIYLSVAIEIFALASVAAASISVSRFSVWTLFGLVTSIQIIGNIFFTYQDINVNSTSFLSWVELIQPWFDDWSNTDHRRLLALIQGGTLPAMSLIALHYYIAFNDKEKNELGFEETKESHKVVEIKAESFPQEVLEKIYNDNSNVDIESLPKTEEEVIVEEIVEETQPETLETEVSEKKIDEISEQETQEEKIDDKIIVQQIKPIEQEVIPSAQWAGGTNKNWQNPQILPGVNN